MGGSLGLALRTLGGGIRVTGHDRDPGTTRRALDRGAIDAGAPSPREAVAEAECVFTAVPPRAALDLVPALLPLLPADAVLADLSSVMTPLRERLAAVPAGAGRFVASHPICGSERDGIEAAREDLYRGRRILVGAPLEPGGAAGRVAGVWKALGADPRPIDPVEHDALLALTSHLPLLASAGLARALRASGRAAADLATAAGPGLRDTSRLAASEPGLWEEILALNAGRIAPALGNLEREIAALRRALEGEPSRLRELLAEARAFRREIVE